MNTRISTITPVLLICLFLVQLPLQAMESVLSDRKVRITYIANEGFLVEAKGKKILIDALFGERELGFCDTPTRETLTSMTSATGVFSDVNLLAATHRHVDHFHAGFVASHLSNNPSASFISCEQSTDALAAMEHYQEIRDQVLPVTPDRLTFHDTVVNGIGVRVYRLIHGPYYEVDPGTGEKRDRHRNVQNLGFLFDIDGVKIFHCGDSGPSCREDYEHFRLDKESIDVAFMGRGFLWSAEGPGPQILEELIDADHIVLMHFKHQEYDRFREVATRSADRFPSITLFKSRMESVELPLFW